MKRTTALAWILCSSAGCSFPTGEFHVGAAVPDVVTPTDRVVAPDVATGDVTDDVAQLDSPDVVSVDSPDVVSVDAPDDRSDAVAVDAPDATPDDRPDAIAVDAPDVVDDVAPDVVCAAGQEMCGGVCVATQSDPSNCGRCGNRCAAANGTATCAAGVCGILCNPGFEDCDRSVDTGCETSLDTVTNCGACGTACSGVNATPSCVSGACLARCSAGFGNCDLSAANGCEAPLNTVANCGACGNTCSANNGTASCVGGNCQIVCASGFGNCDGDLTNGCETPLNSATNCGACTRACPTGQVCGAGGACTTACVAPNTMCSSECVNTSTNVRHCGACGRQCTLPNATPTCAAGVCRVLSCALGFADCDGLPANGCEVDTRTDVNNCGRCATRCAFANAGASCSTGACALGACNAGFGNCDANAVNGCEVNLNTDVLNCGRCGGVCRSHIGSPSNACSAGACVPTCSAGYANCDANGYNGCEAQLGTNASCVACGRTCSGTCTGTACNALPTHTTYFRQFVTRAFVDACAIAGHTTILPSTDDGSALVPLPFAFRFYSTVYSAGANIAVSSNGWVSPSGAAAGALQALIPDANAPNGIIAPFLLDLFTGTNGVCVATVGTGTSRSLLIHWSNARYYAATTTVNFELFLNEGTNTVDFVYGVMAPVPSGYAPTIGVESPDGVVGTTFCNAVNAACAVPTSSSLRYSP